MEADEDRAEVLEVFEVADGGVPFGVGLGIVGPDGVRRAISLLEGVHDADGDAFAYAGQWDVDVVVVGGWWCFPWKGGYLLERAFLVLPDFQVRPVSVAVRVFLL